MNMRWVKIGAVVLVVGFIAWFCSHLRFTEQKVPLPLQGEAITNPYYAAIKLAEQLHSKAAWERIFTVPATDSVILLSNWNWSLSRTRRERIEAWVANGGRLVVDNSLIGGSEEFEKWVGVSHLDHSEDSKKDDVDEDVENKKRGSTNASVAWSSNSSTRTAPRSPRTAPTARSACAASTLRFRSRARASSLGRCARTMKSRRCGSRWGAAVSPC